MTTANFPGVRRTDRGEYLYSLLVNGGCLYGRPTDIETAARDQDLAKFRLLESGHLKYVHRYNFPEEVAKWEADREHAPQPDSIVLNYMRTNPPRYSTPSQRAVAKATKRIPHAKLLAAYTVVVSFPKSDEERAAFHTVAARLKQALKEHLDAVPTV